MTSCKFLFQTQSNLSSAALIGLSSLLFSSEAISDSTEYKLGMSAAFEGPARQIGIQLSEGASLHFDDINTRGGVHQHKLKLIKLDDGYEPPKTVENTKRLIEEYKVDALFTYMGTPTSWAIKPLLERSQLPFITPFTGADFLRSATTFHVFNLRASYQQEAYEQIQFLTQEKRLKKIALLIQADEFGLTLEKSLVKALKDMNLTAITIARFRRNTQDIDKALTRIAASGAEAVAMVGTYDPLAEFIKKAEASKSAFIYSTVSFAFSNALYARLTKPETIMTTEVVPDPLDCDVELCEEFKRLAKHNNITVSRLAFEGYLNAYVTTQALNRCKPPFDKTCLMTQLEDVRIEDHKLQALFNHPQRNKYVVFRSYYQ